MGPLARLRASLVLTLLMSAAPGCGLTDAQPPVTPWAGVALPPADNALPMNDAPVVVVDAAHVVVDGEVVGDVGPIATSHRMMRIDGLFNRLKAKRAAWKAAHPTDLFRGELSLVIDQSTSAAVVKSVFQTAAFAGYPSESFVVRRATPGPDGATLGRLPVDAQVPGAGGLGLRGAPSLRELGTETNGRLSAQVIQHVVRQRFGAMRQCYEAGLARDPKLTGRVTTRFVIGADGRVTEATAVVPEPSKRIPDPVVEACVVGAFAKLSFPAPEGGIVAVVYPISFNPAD